MKENWFRFFTIIISLLFTSCYGSWNIFYEGNNVDCRSKEMALLEDSTDPVFQESGLSSLSGSYDVLILTDTHFGYKFKDAPLECLYNWLDSVKESPAAPEFAICLGDAVDTGCQSEYDEYLDFCKNLQNRYGIKLVFTTCGNHDIYQSHWGNWQKNCYPHTSFYSFKTSNFSWYSFDTGDGTLGTKQYDILKKAMENDPAPKIVFSHYPLSAYRIAFGLGDTTERNLLVRLFLQNKVRCYFGGHDHCSNYNNIGFHDYCCPSFRFNEAWTILHVDEDKGKAVAEFIGG